MFDYSAAEGEATAPLVAGALDDIFAHCFSEQPALGFRQGQWTKAEFLGHALRLAERLPEHDFAINLCENRYLFTVAFCAAIIRGQTSLLAQNRAPATQAQLLENYENAYILHDGLDCCAVSASQLNINDLTLLGDAAAQSPQVDLDFLAAIAFTSGSTGKPKANLKFWRTFIDSSRINARYMLPEAAQVSLVATVPAQHMWGMETSVLLPLFNRLSVADSKPLFAQDVVNRLRALAPPRVLVSTPVHLRAIVQSGLPLPQVERILCATAPLSAELAAQVENAFGGELVEVYGCSEVGSMACRRASLQQEWRLFDGLNFVDAQEPMPAVTAAHLPERITLSDRVEMIGSRRFRLLGRSDDMLEVAGKRGSLQELNKVLLAAPGVVDGVVFLPEDEHRVSVRPAAMVVAEAGLSKHLLSEHFRQHLDPVFVPRPIVFVGRLPREENGKLPQGKLLRFWQQLRE